MPVFTYSGKSENGEKVSGERVAANKQALAAQLRKERINAGAIREKGKEFVMPTFGSGKVKTKEIAIFFRQFSVMIDAGLPLVQCLEILAANQENQAFQKTLTGVRTTVEGGSTLANAMRQFPKIFDDLSTNMIEAGETGGILDIILQRLAVYVEKAVKLRGAVKSALIYPVSVISMAVLIVAALLKWVVPIFANLFAGLGVALPLPTRIVVGLERLRKSVLVVLHHRCRGHGFRGEADSQESQGPLLHGLRNAQNAHRRHVAAQDRSSAIYPDTGDTHHFRRADS